METKNETAISMRIAEIMMISVFTVFLMAIPGVLANGIPNPTFVTDDVDGDSTTAISIGWSTDIAQNGSHSVHVNTSGVPTCDYATVGVPTNFTLNVGTEISYWGYTMSGSGVTAPDEIFLFLNTTGSGTSVDEVVVNGAHPGVAGQWKQWNLSDTKGLYEWYTVNETLNIILVNISDYYGSKVLGIALGAGGPTTWPFPTTDVYLDNLTVSGSTLTLLDDDTGTIEVLSGTTDSTPWTTSIQDGIDAALPGDTIYVHAGTYNENVVVNKQLTLIGESRETTTIDGGGSDVVVYVNADGVNISGFNITNGGTHGIHLYNSNNDVISDCIITSNAVLGIYFKPSSSYNTITGCDVCYNGASGIDIGDWQNQKYNTIVNCNVYSNTHWGIGGYITSDGTVVRDCNIYSNGWDGIRVGWSSWTITNNTISNNLNGIILDTAVNTVITDCIIDSNTNIGVMFAGIPSRYNTVKNCTISNNNIGAQLGNTDEHDNELINCTLSNNDIGIDFGKSTKNRVINCTITGSSQYGILLKSTTSSNTLIGNTVTSNNDYGIYMESSSNNLLYNNYFNNPNNAYDTGDNTWNITKTAGTNIIGGPYLGGNYWSDYAGEDLDEDGLGDTLLPYNSSGNITNGGDYLPLVPPVLLVQANITIKPETLNLKSKGMFTAFITLPEPYNIADIDISTVECEGAPAVKGMVAGNKYIAKFDRKDLIGVEPGPEVELTVTGELFDGTLFEGSDTIRMIAQGKGK